MLILIKVFVCVFVTYVPPAFSSPINSDDNVPCESGWYYFRDKCYKSWGREPSEWLSWRDALAQCKSHGADLVSIQSQEEQDFVTAYLLRNASWWAWIGLNDFDDIGHFEWTDGSVFNYSNWHRGYPSLYYLDEPEYCVQMNMYHDGFGPWNDRNCDGEFAYICEKNANEEVSSQNPVYCSSEEGGGWKNKNFCYHVIQEKKSWENAENYCKDYYNGHLLTISELMEDYFLDLAIPDIKKDMWIGIKMENSMQLKWTSGWFVAYERYSSKWNTVTEGDCVARRKSEDWITIPCSTELPFICEVSRKSPPALKPPPIGAHCPEEQDYWRDFGGEYCYYFEPRKCLTFDEANEDCNSRGGHMVSLHSEEEADILQPFFKDKQWSIHIGLHRKDEDNGTFGWIDGTELDYQNWVDGEPDNVEEPLSENWGGPDKVQEPCVEMWILTKKWNDIPCNKGDVGYVCAVKKIVSESTPVYETTSSEIISPTFVTESNLVDETTSDIPIIVSESNLVDETTTNKTDIPTIVSESTLVYETTSSETVSAIMPKFDGEQTSNSSLEEEMPAFDDEQPLNSTSENESFTFDDIQALNASFQEESFTFDDIQALNASFQEEMPAFDDEQPLNSTSEKEMTTFDDDQPSNSTVGKEMPTFDEEQPLNSTVEKDSKSFILLKDSKLASRLKNRLMVPRLDDEQPLNSTSEKEMPKFDKQPLNLIAVKEILTFDDIQALNTSFHEETLTFYDILALNATLQNETLLFADIEALKATLQKEMPASDNAQPLNETPGK